MSDYYHIWSYLNGMNRTNAPCTDSQRDLDRTLTAPSVLTAPSEHRGVHVSRKFDPASTSLWRVERPSPPPPRVEAEVAEIPADEVLRGIRGGIADHVEFAGLLSLTGKSYHTGGVAAAWGTKREQAGRIPSPRGPFHRQDGGWLLIGA